MYYATTRLSITESTQVFDQTLPLDITSLIEFFNRSSLVLDLEQIVKTSIKIY